MLQYHNRKEEGRITTILEGTLCIEILHNVSNPLNYQDLHIYILSNTIRVPNPCLEVHITKITKLGACHYGHHPLVWVSIQNDEGSML